MADTKTFYPLDATLVEGGELRGAQFVDFAGLDYFWSLAKNYVDTADAALAARATALETTVNGTPNAEGVLENGLVQKVAALRSEVDALGGAEGGIQGMIDASIEALDLDNKFAGADTAAQGYASSALTDAKAYVDGIVNDTTGEDGSVEKGLKSQITDVANALDAHVNATYDLADGSKASIHLAAGEREAWDKAKADIDAFLADANMGGDVVDTLKELQTYMANDTTAATQLVNRVGALETSVGAAASVGEDGVEVPATGLYKVIAENEKTTAAALSDLDGKITKLDTDLKKYADDAADAAGAQALTDAKKYVDDIVNDTVDTEGNTVKGLNSKIADTLTEAKSYTDTLFAEITFVSKASIDSLFA